LTPCGSARNALAPAPTQLNRQSRDTRVTRRGCPTPATPFHIGSPAGAPPRRRFVRHLSAPRESHEEDRPVDVAKRRA
jgi:hypothetical protein